MTSSSLPDLEHSLEARLLEPEKVHEARPSLLTALARAGACQRIDEPLGEIADRNARSTLSLAESLQDAAMKLRRLSRIPEGPEPARLLEGALEAVERAAEPQS